jgi:hypothetical protein
MDVQMLNCFSFFTRATTVRRIICAIQRVRHGLDGQFIHRHCENSRPLGGACALSSEQGTILTFASAIRWASGTSADRCHTYWQSWPDGEGTRVFDFDVAGLDW